MFLHTRCSYRENRKANNSPSVLRGRREERSDREERRATTARTDSPTASRCFGLGFSQFSAPATRRAFLACIRVNAKDFALAPRRELLRVAVAIGHPGVAPVFVHHF